MAEPDTDFWRLLAEPVLLRPRGLRPCNRYLLQSLVYLGGDLAALVAAYFISIWCLRHFLRIPSTTLSRNPYYGFYVLFFVLTLFLFGGYNNPQLRRPERELELGSKAAILTLSSLILCNMAAFNAGRPSYYPMVTWFAAACLLLLSVRLIIRAVHDRRWKAGIGRRKTILLGSPAWVCDYEQLLAIQRHHGRELLGWIPESLRIGDSAAEVSGLPVVGSPDRWEEAIRDTGAEVLVVSPLLVTEKRWLFGQILRQCGQLHVDLEVYSPAVLAPSDPNCGRDEFSRCVQFYSRTSWSTALQRFAKRGLDLLAGVIGAAVTLLLTPAIAALIKLEDNGPVFYRSAYLSQNGDVRYYLKFRTMHVDADRRLESDEQLRSRFAAQHKLVDDPRVTRLGRFLRRSSLDELPQFFSVLKGDLSFVGPRTIRRAEAARYGSQLGKLLSFKPGMTGFWQTMGRQTTTYEERVKMDIFYIDHWSIWLDLVIAVKTLWKVLSTEGAH